MVKSPRRVRVVLGVCGSIAAYKAGDIIRRLREKGRDVTVVMTVEAKQFITPLTLSVLSGKEIYGSMFDADGWRMGHIELSRQADVLVIAPATANIMAKIAHGFADDLLSALAITLPVPLLLPPPLFQKLPTPPCTPGPPNDNPPIRPWATILPTVDTPCMLP